MDSAEEDMEGSFQNPENKSFQSIRRTKSMLNPKKMSSFLIE